jgi:hypothetical protein
MGSRELDAIVRKVKSNTQERGDRIVHATSDNLVASCEEFWVRVDGKEKRVRDLPEYTGNREIPVRYDESLAEFLGFSNELPDPPTARSVVLALFGGNDIALGAHGARLAQWMMKSGTEADLELGEL